MDAAGYPLQAGHHNMRRLLDVFSSQLHAFEHGRTPDLLLMHDILDCLNRYVAISDGVAQDGSNDALSEADASVAPARLVLNADQEAIGELGERCLALIEDMIGGVVVSRSELLTPGRRYLRLFQDHLRREQAYLQRYRRETSDGPLLDSLCQPRPGDPRGEFMNLCKRILEVTAQLKSDEFGLSVCAACGIAAASGAGTQSIALGT